MSTTLTPPTSTEPPESVKAAAFSALKFEIDRHGTGKFTADERDALLDAGVALVLGQADAAEAVEKADDILDRMQPGRLGQEAAANVAARVRACAGQ